MIQQIIALVFICFFIFRLIVLKRKNNLGHTEYIMWFIFWLASAIMVVFIKKIDLLVASLGFSSAGIEVILYVATSVLFYLYFRSRLRIEKIEKDITTLTREIALKKDEKK